MRRNDFDILKETVRQHFNSPEFAHDYLLAGLSADHNLYGKITPNVFSQLFLVERPDSRAAQKVINQLVHDSTHNLLLLESHSGSGKTILIEAILSQQLSGAYYKSYVDFGKSHGNPERSIETVLFQFFRHMYRRACKNEVWYKRFMDRLKLIAAHFDVWPASIGYIEILTKLSKQLDVEQSISELFIGHSHRLWNLQDSIKVHNIILLLYLLLIACESDSPDRKYIIVFDNFETVVQGDTDRIAIIQGTMSFLSEAFSSIEMEDVFYTQFTIIISVRTTSPLSYSILSRPHLATFGSHNQYILTLQEYDFSGAAILKKLRYLVDIDGNNTPLFTRCLQVASLIMPRDKIEEWLSASNASISPSIIEPWSKHIMAFFHYNYRRLISHLFLVTEDIECDCDKTRTGLCTISILQQIDMGYAPTAEEAILLSNTIELAIGQWYLSPLNSDDTYLSLPESISKLIALESLDISNSSISNLPESIGHLTRLKSLSLSNTHVNELPNSICNLLNLRSLYLDKTRISILPDSLRALKKIESIDISGTLIHILPQWIGDLPQLQHLNLAGLSLHEIPESLGLCGLRFIENQHFISGTQGVNLYGVELLNQEKTVFLESPDLISGLYTTHTFVTQDASRSFDSQSAIDNFFGELPNSVPSFSSFIEFINNHPNQVIRSYAARNFPALFKFETNGANLIPSNFDENIQNLLYQIFLVDSGYSISDEKPAINTLSQRISDSIVNLVDPEKDNYFDTIDLSDNESDNSTGPKPTEVEKATRIVLEAFNAWLINNTKYRVNKRAKRQFAGVQYGYDVGTNIRTGKALFRLCFECKRLNQLKPLNDDNPGEIKIQTYSYNFLQFYMHCPRTLNNRWILVSPYGELQNEFEENLIDKWNTEHPFLQIHAITQTSTTLTCKRFFSVDEEAFHLIYPNEKYPEECKEDIFAKIMDFIGEDLVGNKLQEKLNEFPFWETYGYHDALLPIRTIEKADSFEVVLSQLKSLSTAKKERTKTCNGQGSYGNGQHGIFIVGNAGTGKSWITYQIVEELILNQSSYHLLPIYIELRSLNISETMDSNDRRDAINRKKAELLKKYPTLRTQEDTVVFVLDGFDEMISGLSKTDIKVTFLLEFEQSLRGSFNSPLFVITSRESDYVACKSHREFGEIVRRFKLVQLDHESCTESDIKEALEKLAQRHIELASQFSKLASNDQLLKIMRRPFFFGLLIDFIALTGSIHFEDEERIDEYTVLKKIVDGTAYDFDIKKNDRDEWNKLALKMTQENLTAVPFIPEKHSDEGLKLFTTIETDDQGTRKIAFRHNILREYFVGEFLYNELPENGDDTEEKIVKDNSFLRTIQKTPLCPEVERAFIAFIQKSSDTMSKERQLKQFVCQNEVKEDPVISTALMEILLQPGSDLSGTAENPLDLSGIHTRNLFLWNCGLQHINLQKAVMQNLQLVDVRLTNIDLRNADLTGLQVFSNHPIIGATSWYDLEKWHIIALNSAGQCIDYSLDNLDYEDRYSAKISSIDGMISENKKLSDSFLTFFHGGILYCSKNYLYDLQRQELLYKFGLNHKKLRRVCTFQEDGSDGTCLLFESDAGVSNVVFLGNKAVLQVLPTKTPNSVSFVDYNNTVYLHDMKLILRSGNNDIVLADQCEDIECFTTVKTASGLDVVMLTKQLIRVIMWDGKNVSEKPLTSENERSQSDQCFFLQRIANNTFFACSQSKMYKLTLYETTYKAVELKASVTANDLRLEDEAGNCMKDEIAYNLLHG